MASISKKEQDFREDGKFSDLFVCVNTSNQSFTFTYFDDTNSEIPYEIPAGQSRTWQRYIVSHYAKHFINHELNRQGSKTNVEVKRDEIFDNIVKNKVSTNLSPSIAAPDEQPVNKKRGRPRKDEPTGT